MDSLTKLLKSGEIKTKDIDTSRKDAPLRLNGIGALFGNPFGKDIEMSKEITKKEGE